MTQKLTFGSQGLPPLVKVKPYEPVTIEVPPEGELALTRAATAQGQKTEYHGIPQWSARAVGMEHRYDGDKPFVDSFVHTGIYPGTGMPGTHGTFLPPETIDLPALNPGESVEFWIDLGRGAYFSNFGANITVKAEE